MKTFAIFVLVFVVGAGCAPNQNQNSGPTHFIHTENGVVGLNLQKSETKIFHSDFRVLFSTHDAAGQAQFVDRTPLVGEINDIENRIHTDKAANVVVSLKSVNGVTQLFGAMDNKMISFHEEDGVHRVDAELEEDTSSGFDYMQVPNPGPVIHVNRSADAIVSPELLLVVDNQLYQILGGNVARISEYVAIFVKSVNNRYDTSLDPRVTVKITGILIMENLASQPFIENHRNPDGTYNHSLILQSFSQYMASNSASLPPHDVGALLTNTTFVGVNGVAYRGAACRSGFKYSVNRDNFAIFRGVGTLSHELGHNFGSPHDGEVPNGSGDCPSTDGFIMSGTGRRDENSFYFSPCSKTLMNSFFGTATSNCLYTDEATSSWTPSPLMPGDRADIADYCVAYRPDAVVSATHSPDDLCKNVRCSYRAPCTPPNEHLTCTWGVTLNIPPPDGASCGSSGGKCTLGWCR